MNRDHISNDKYLSIVSRFSKFIQTQERKFLNAGLPTTWYRGQSNKDWKLVPGILRDNIQQAGNNQKSKSFKPLPWLLMKERNILHNFKREGSAMNNKTLSNKEWYYLAQHHGLPTRLLDWTSNPRVALWFAIYGDDNEDGIIHSIRSNNYNHDTILNDRLQIETKFYDIMFSAKKVKENKALLDGKIYAVSPDSYNDRQSRQSSLFTLHLPDISFEQEYSTGESEIKPLDSFIIPKEEKPILRTFLSAEGMQRWHVFPDLDNLSKGLREEMLS